MNATLMDTLNTPMKTRQKRLGHAQIETTLKHYTHAIDADDQLAADQIGALLSPSANQPSVERFGSGFMWLRSFKEMPPEPRELEEKTEALGIRIKRETR
jgi:hypothetical protein